MLQAFVDHYKFLFLQKGRKMLYINIYKTSEKIMIPNEEYISKYASFFSSFKSPIVCFAWGVSRSQTGCTDSCVHLFNPCHVIRLSTEYCPRSIPQDLISFTDRDMRSRRILCNRTIVSVGLTSMLSIFGWCLSKSA